jgi:diguanylate cyclase (GGDEF)-like protein/PAS domain S-box-containing protein
LFEIRDVGALTKSGGNNKRQSHNVGYGKLSFIPIVVKNPAKICLSPLPRTSVFISLKDKDKKNMLVLRGATLRYVFYTLLLAIIYYGIFLVSQWLDARYATVIPTMLAGVALGTSLLFGIPAWLGIALGSELINLHLELLPLYNITTTAGTVVEVVMATTMLRYYRLSDDFSRVRDVMLFAGVTWLLAPLFGASISNIPIFISPEISSDYIFKIWMTDWLIHALALFIIAPLLLVWQNLPMRPTTRLGNYWLEVSLLLISLIGISHLTLHASDEFQPVLLALMLPLSLWAAIRFEQHGATVAAAAITLILLGDNGLYFYSKQTTQFELNELLLNVLLIAITTLTLFVIAALWTQQRQRQQQLMREQQLATLTLHSIADAVITTDKQGDITYLNPVAAELTGWMPAQYTLGKNALEIFQIKSLDNANDELQHPIKLSLQGIISPPQQCLLVNRDRVEKVIETSAAPIGHPDRVEGVIVVFHDISKEHNLREQLTHQACHDALTGLYNRREFEFRLNTLINTVKNTTQSHSLLYLDLDQFKVVNDTSGHLAGDALLKQLVTVVQGRVRGDDTFARLGGDEFAIILKNCPIERAGGVATSFLNTVHDFRFVWEGKTFEVGVSIGVVPINAHSENIATVLSKADLACYAAKEAGRNRIYVLDDNDQTITSKQNEVHWTTHLLQAIEQQRLVLYRQPIVSLQQSNIVHYELLIRMKDARGLIVSPGSFLPAAERYNLIAQLDKWVIHKVLTHLAQHPPNLKSCGFFSINLSATSLNDATFLQFIHNELKQLTVPTQLICFELTETAVVSSLDKASHLMKEMTKLGFRFALDNFGSGFSSFGYLKQLPIDYLKIDGKFVRDMMTDSVDRVIVESMHRIGHEMQIKTIAEWVEDDATRAILQKIGIDFAQGFSIGKPEPFL